jgi:dienelactone hydrolase
MRKSLSIAAYALVGLSAVCVAQPPPGVTPEMIAMSLPEEGAPKAVPGPYQVTAEPAFGSSALKTFRPANLDAFPKRDTLPVVVWGNGGCAIENPKYAGFLTTIASHGFLVITTTGTPPGEGTPGQRATADNLKAAIDWAEQENSRAGSPLKGKIHTQQMAVMGQSCGGFLSITLGADPRVGTIGVFNSGVQAAAPGAPAGNFPTTDALKKLHGPVLLINGGDRDFMKERSKATYDAIESLLRLATRSRPYRDGLPCRRRRVCECGLELGDVAVQGRQESGQDVYGREVRAVHRQQLGRGVQALGEMRGAVS